MGGVVVVLAVGLVIPSFFAGEKMEEPVDNPFPPLFPCCCCCCCCPPFLSKDFVFRLIPIKEVELWSFGVMLLVLALDGGGVDAVVEVVREGEDGDEKEVKEVGDLMLDGFFLVDESHAALLFPWPLLLAWMLLLLVILLMPRMPSVVSSSCC
jgi:hypothetical protein